MQAVLMRQTGGPDVLRFEEVESPVPADGEVLIRVRAVSVNPIDWKYRAGLAERQLPTILGNDIAGTIAESRAEGFAEGDDVFGFAASGGYAELATSAPGMLAKKPDAVSFERAAAGRPPWSPARRAASGTSRCSSPSTRARGSSGPDRRAAATSCSAWAPTSTSTTRSRTSARR